MRPRYPIPALPPTPFEWSQTSLLPYEVEQWKAAFAEVYGADAPGSLSWPWRAERLAKHGFTAASLLQALETRGVALPWPKGAAGGMDAAPQVRSMTEADVEASAVMADELLRAYSTFTSAPAQARDFYVVALRKEGWSFREIGDLLGMSKQRVQQIYKSEKPPRWSTALGTNGKATS